MPVTPPSNLTGAWALSVLSTVLNAIVNLFSTVMDAVGLEGWFISMLLCAWAIRGVIQPIVGGNSGSSDTVLPKSKDTQAHHQTKRWS